MRLQLNDTLTGPGPRQSEPLQRLRNVVDLGSGETLAALVETARDFEDRPAFGVAAGEPRSVAAHVGKMIEGAGKLPRANGPLILPLPITALCDADMRMACDAAVRRAGLLHQEIVLEVPDAALATDRLDAISRLAGFKRLGFRIGLDLRKSKATPLGEGVCLMLDTLRLDAREIDGDARLREKIEAARAGRVLMIAEHARWQNGPSLAQLGVTAAISPKADA